MEITEQTAPKDLLAIINDPAAPEHLYEQASREHRRRLLMQKQASEMAAQRIKDAVQTVRKLNVTFEELADTKADDGGYAFDRNQIRDYAAKKGWITGAAMRKPRASNDSKEKSQSLIVGNFKLSDYNFQMPVRAGTNKPFSDATELQWDFNYKYAGTSWELKLIRAIVSKGVPDILPRLTPEFKAWLDIAEIPDRGAYAGNRIYRNKRKFYRRFGVDENLKPL